MSTIGEFTPCEPGAFICAVSCSPPNCPDRSNAANGSWLHEIHTNSSINLWGNTVQLAKTDRSFNWDSLVKRENGPCGGQELTIEGTISENIVSESAVLYFLSVSEKVALYKRTLYTIDFSGSVDKIVGFFGELVQYYGIATITNPNITRTEEIIFLSGDEQKILSHYTMPSTTPTSTWKTFAFPNPAPDAPLGIPGDSDVAANMPYNQYPYCDESVDSTLTGLDGGRDMFYPEWARTILSDSEWKYEAWARIQGCKDPSFVPPEVYIPEIIVDPIPHGDFARHPELGDCYSWLLTEFGTAIVNYPENTLPILGNVVGEELKENTVLYPISLY